MSVTREYWFARRFPVGHPSAALAPVHWKGWAVSAVFMAVLTIGGLGFAWMAASGYLIQGLVLFIVAAVVGAAMVLDRRSREGRSQPHRRRL